MTRLDRLKSSDDAGIAKFICMMTECERCPAIKYCWIGHNGMLDYLNKSEFEREDDYEES